MYFWFHCFYITLFKANIFPALHKARLLINYAVLEYVFIILNAKKAIICISNYLITNLY